MKKEEMKQNRATGGLSSCLVHSSASHSQVRYFYALLLPLPPAFTDGLLLAMACDELGRAGDANDKALFIGHTKEGEWTDCISSQVADGEVGGGATGGFGENRLARSCAVARRRSNSVLGIASAASVGMLMRPNRG